MRTIYGVAPMLTDKGHTTGRLAPVVVRLTDTTERAIGKALYKVPELRPKEKGDPSDEIFIGLEGQYSTHHVPPALHVPDLQIRIRPNFGSLKEGNKRGHDGIVEIAANTTFTEESPKHYTVVRDSLLRNAAEGQVSFTNELLRGVIENGMNMEGVVAEGHRDAMAKSVINLATGGEGGWMLRLSSPRWGQDSSPLITPETRLANQELGGIKFDVSIGLTPSLEDITEAMFAINPSIGKPGRTEGAIRVEGNGRKEAL